MDGANAADAFGLISTGFELLEDFADVLLSLVKRSTDLLNLSQLLPELLYAVLCAERNANRANEEKKQRKFHSSERTPNDPKLSDSGPGARL